VAGDSSGNGYSGSFPGGAANPSWVQGKYGSALSFTPADNDRVNLGSVSALNATNLTMCAWIYPRSVPNYPNIFSNISGTDGFDFYLDGFGANITVNTSFGTGAYGSGPGIILNKWQFVCAVHNGSSYTGISVYINGVDVTNVRSAGSDKTPGTGASYIGNDPTSTYDFDGSIDEFRFYNRVLSSTEIMQLYQSGMSSVNKSLTNRLTSGLAGYWTMDGMDTNWSTNTIVDKSGLGRTGTLKNMATSTVPTIGKIGQAFKLDGVNDFITMGDVNAVDSLTAITVAAWVKVGSDATERHIVDKSLCDGATNGGPFELYMVSHKAVFAMYPVSGTPANFVNTSQSVSAIDDNQSHFLVGRYDGSNIELWIDGVRDPGYQAYSSLTMSNTTNELQIGGDCSGVGIGNGYEWPGLIDEVRVYTRAITPAEIKQLYNMGTVKLNSSQGTRATSGLIGYWSFNGPDISWSANTAYDRSGQGNNGTITNMSTSSSPTIGKVGQALSFDGVNDNVNLGRVSATESASQLTWSFWAYANVWQDGDGFISKEVPYNTGSWHIGISSSCNVGNQLIVYIATTDGDGGTLGCADISSATGRWIHYAVVFDGTQTGNANRLKIYVDGVQDSVLDFIGTIPASTIVSANNVRIGSDSAGNANLSGKIDEVRIYNRALSLFEIKQLYNMGR
jgi:hypothetical protein